MRRWSRDRMRTVSMIKMSAADEWMRVTRRDFSLSLSFIPHLLLPFFTCLTQYQRSLNSYVRGERGVPSLLLHHFFFRLLLSLSVSLAILRYSICAFPTNIHRHERVYQRQYESTSSNFHCDAIQRKSGKAFFSFFHNLVTRSLSVDPRSFTRGNERETGKKADDLKTLPSSFKNYNRKADVSSRSTFFSPLDTFSPNLT